MSSISHSSNEKSIKDFGSWPSPITTQSLTKGAKNFSQILCDGDDLYWLETRPDEKGRSVIVKQDPQGNVSDISPKQYSTRSRAHEYGGKCFAVKEGIVYFSNDLDQNIYRINSLNPEEAPEQITFTQSTSYADHILHPSKPYLICIQEQHIDGEHEARASIIAVNTEDKSVTTLKSGDDFYSNPEFSPDGNFFSWLCWNHPNMPWDCTELWLAETNVDITVGKAYQVKTHGTEEKDESIFQPSWAPDNTLCFVSDSSNWWNLYQHSPTTNETKRLNTQEAEYGLPQWQFGMSTYTFLNSDTILATSSSNGAWRLSTIDLNTGRESFLNAPYSWFTQLHSAGNNQAYFLSANAYCTPQITHLNTEGELAVLHKASSLEINPASISAPEFITFAKQGESAAYGLYFKPCNEKCSGPDGQKPPLIVMAHGGPTGATDAYLNMKIQFWTSRGFAVLDINYHGSTGYGREFRDSLKQHWGIKDTEDMITGAQSLVDKGLVDANKLAIRGSSAGGYTVLSALTFHDFFHAGTSLYGIGNLESLLQDTHKFEARYLDSLIGPYPKDEAIYKQRSPLLHAEQLNCPTLFLQGLEDKVVPPQQAEEMVQALDNNNTPVAYVTFENEGHGFRQAENIEKALESEYYFYSRIFDFKTAEELETVAIKNL